MGGDSSDGGSGYRSIGDGGLLLNPSCVVLVLGMTSRWLVSRACDGSCRARVVVSIFSCYLKVQLDMLTCSSSFVVFGCHFQHGAGSISESVFRVPNCINECISDVIHVET